MIKLNNSKKRGQTLGSHCQAFREAGEKERPKNGGHHNKRSPISLFTSTVSQSQKNSLSFGWNQVDFTT
jgi:hypothetical protein